MVNKRRNSMCTFCYKPALSSSPALSNDVRDLKHSDTKFLLLLSRHLKIHPNSSSKEVGDEFLAKCEDCSKLGADFSDLYFQVECLKLQLKWKLRRIYETMLYAGRVPSRFAAFRKQFETENAVSGDEQIEGQKLYQNVQEMRKLFIKRCKQELKSGHPKVHLERISGSERKMKTEKLTPQKKPIASGAIELDILACANNNLLPVLLTYIAVLHLSLPLHPSLIHKSYQEYNVTELVTETEVENGKAQTSVSDQELPELSSPSLYREEVDDNYDEESNLDKLEVAIVNEYDCDDDEDFCDDNESQPKEEPEVQMEVDVGCSEILLIKSECVTMPSESEIPATANLNEVVVENNLLQAPHNLVITEETDNLSLTCEPVMKIDSQTENLADTSLQTFHKIIVKIDIPTETENLTDQIDTPSSSRKSLRSLFKCSKCAKTFANQEKLNKHSDSHKDELISTMNSDSEGESYEEKMDFDFEENESNSESLNDDEMDDSELECEIKEDLEESSKPQPVVLSSSEPLASSMQKLNDNSMDNSTSESELEEDLEETSKPKADPSSSAAKRASFCRKKPRNHHHRPTRCGVCKKTFDSVAATEKHRVVVHDLGAYVCCPVCHDMLYYHHNLVRHRSNKGRCFTKKLKDLEPAAAPRFPYLKNIRGRKFCPHENCFEVFTFDEWLDVHLKTHGNWYCSHCPAEFSKAHDLAEHELKKHNSKPNTNPCTRCNFTYKGTQRGQSVLIAHFVHNHLDIPKVGAVSCTTNKFKRQCDICKKVLAPSRTEANLEEHKKLQHDVSGMDPESIATCTVCKAPFTNRVHLTNHMKDVHNQKEAIIQCPHCDKRYKRVANFRAHLKKTHKGKTSGFAGSFQCDICKERFPCQGNLDQHKKSHESKKLVFECKICHKQFMTKQTLNNHVNNVHKPPKQTWHCESCGKIFKNKQKLGQHTSYTHTDPSEWKFPCPEEGCGKRCWSRQKLTEHIRTHTKERTFVCDVCGESYRYRQYLQTHLAKAHGSSAANTLPTQQYTKPFDQAVKVQKETEEVNANETQETEEQSSETE